MVLYINTTQIENAEISLKQEDGEIIAHEGFPARKKLSETLIAHVQLLLDAHGLSKSDIRAIEVNPGPGSFTGTRIGVAVANALGLGLGISVNGLQGTPVVPMYNKDAHITKSSKFEIGDAKI